MGGGKGGGGGGAPDPDPRIGEAALKNAELGRQWLDFARVESADAKERQKILDSLTTRIGEEQLETQGRANDWSKDDRERWEKVFRPLEDRVVESAETWDSDDRQAQVAAEAKADVLSNAGQQREATQRNMASMGIDPRSGRYAGVDRAAEQGTALAAAGAQNNARKQVRNQGVAMRADAANMGRGLPSQAAQGASLGLTAGNSALAGQRGTNAAAGQSSQIMNQGFSGAMQGNSSMMQGLNQQYGNELQAWSANRQAASQESAGLFGGLGQAVGTGASLYMMSSKDAKTDKAPVDGSALEAVKGMPVESWRYKDGIEDGGQQEHIGPYAEDFQQATGKGDGQKIPLQDMMGLQLKAIQELGIKVDKLEGKKGSGRRPDDIQADYQEKMA